MKVAFFGTSNFSLPILEILHEQYEVVSVITTPDQKVGRKQIITPSEVGLLAEELKLPTLKPQSLKNFASELQNLGADIFIVSAYGKIIPGDVLNLPKYKSINIHPSLLPKYRGPSPIQYALLNGDKETGTTIMLMDEEVDHGPILAQKSLKIDDDDTFLTLSDKLAKLSSNLLLDVLPNYISGQLSPTPQQHGNATFTKLISKTDGKISWKKIAQEIYNQFRAFYPWPGIWTTWNNQVLKITHCAIAYESSDAQVGTVLEGGKVVCGNKTVLQIKNLQLEGKNETNIKSFLNGYKNFVGGKLG